MRIRPITHADFYGLKRLAEQAGIGFTSLPVDDAILQRRINRAVESFRGNLEPALTDYLFVLELPSGEVGGCCAIAGAVGIETPLYHYRKMQSVRYSVPLQSTSCLDLLFLSHDLVGCTELCTLLLSTQARGMGVGGFLSKSRFLFMAEFPPLFSERSIAEMRGCLNADGIPPFWEAVSRHFFQSDFLTVNRLAGAGDKSFMAEMVLDHPIYLDMLSEAVRQTVGQVQPDTLPALRLLESEGFRRSEYVDIVDAGPVMVAETRSIRAVRESKVYQVAEMKQINDENKAQASYWIIANHKKEGFRSVLSITEPQELCCFLTPKELQWLELDVGESVRAVKIVS